MHHEPARIALVTGGSTGIGADVANRLADADTHVVRAGTSVESAAMIDTIGARFGRLDTLVFTSGELSAAMRVDRDAQRRIALRALPLMPAGGRIVFVTSHQAHFFPNKAVPKGYTAIAATMRANETALYAMRSEFARADVHFTVVSGDLSDATFADAVVNAANTPNPSGVVYVGRADYLMTA
ncbi:short chain dehydrogenase [Mycolicibacterium flavescens]|uniref:Short chain dehydrogenase n=1 Tax=Mycolicibacterium flavescens TaxID=1776 RepID=A0A1E3RDY4_MYCFV|nr:short chain dehydrogenase [Mycolicibacterium flavescens]MCV7280714.1 short chain dehydrogenase [Mycolicibacterium flavescens]ODQ88063.1 short chain dehydrogenase [Mycolicibacterium flavescens]